MKISIRSEDGAFTSLVVDPRDKIYEVKNKAVDEGGASACLRHLLFSGKELDDGRTLLDYGIKAESVLRLDSPTECSLEQEFLLIPNVPKGSPDRPTIQPPISRDQTANNNAEVNGFNVKQLISRAAEHDYNLTGIHVWNEYVGNEMAARLAEAIQHNQHILDLSIYSAGIGSAGATSLMRALRNNQKLQKLYFGSTDLGEDGIEALGDMLRQNHTLRALILREANIGGVGAQIMAVSLCQNRTLSRLDLWKSQIGSHGCAALSTALGVNQALTSLCLSANSICSRGAEVLACALKQNCTLKRLDLGANSISGQGAMAVADALLRNSTLSDLCFSDNNVEDEGAEALASALCVNSSLEKLDLRSNGISWKGAAALARALRHNRSLSKLVLHDNEVSDDGAKELAQTLNTNIVLTELFLCNNCINNEGAKALRRVAYRNTSLKLLDLRGNSIDASIENEIRGLLRMKRGQSTSDVELVSELLQLSSIDEGRQTLDNVLSSPDLGPGPIPYEYIKNSTNNFSKENLITEGFFGQAFRGRDSNLELDFVVKKHTENAGSLIEKEIEALAGFRHNNVARLVGYCLGTDSDGDGCLVYAVGSEGSLQGWLECYKKRSKLHWTTRINIALEMALAVQSFAKSKKECFLGIQSSTIFLSEDFSPVMIPDLISADYEEASSERVQGKCDDEDIFSLGIVLAELLTGVLQDFSGNFNGYTDTCAGDWVECLREEFTRLIRDCVVPDSGNCPLMEDIIYRLRVLAAKALPYSWGKRNHLTVLCSSPLVWKDNEGHLTPIQNNPDFEAEKRLILSTTADKDISVTFDVATFERLQVAIASRSRCLHFSGHGFPNQLLFEDGKGCARFLDGDKLHDYIHTEPFQFVFVSACFSQYMGEALVKAGVKHVVCVERDSELRDRAAIEFTHIFYFSAFRGFTIADSFLKGKQRVSANFGQVEAEKFMLLPVSGDHNVPLFDRGMRGTTNHIEKERFIPPIPICTSYPRQTDVYKLLQLILSRRLVTIVGGGRSERSSLASTVCRFIDDRKSIFLNIQSIHYMKQLMRKKGSQQEGSFVKSLHCRLLAERKEAKTQLNSVCKGLMENVVTSLIGSPSLMVFDEYCINDELVRFIVEVLEATGTVKFLLTCQESLNEKCFAMEECVFPLLPFSEGHSSVLQS